MSFVVARMGTAGLIGAIALALAGCGNPQFEESFNTQFEKSAKESCVKSATEAGAPAAQVEPYCTCFVGQLSGLSMQEKMKLDPASETIKQAVAACRPK